MKENRSKLIESWRESGGKTIELDEIGFSDCAWKVRWTSQKKSSWGYFHVWGCLSSEPPVWGQRKGVHPDVFRFPHFLPICSNLHSLFSGMPRFFPWRSHPCFFWFPCSFRFPILFSFVRVPSSSSYFRGKRKTLFFFCFGVSFFFQKKRTPFVFFRGFPCFFWRKQGLEGPGSDLLRFLPICSQTKWEQISATSFCLCRPMQTSWLGGPSAQGVEGNQIESVSRMLTPLWSARLAK